METSTMERLKAARDALDEQIKLVHGCGLRDTEGYLRIARLDLQMKINSISIGELQEFCKSFKTRPDRQRRQAAGQPSGSVAATRADRTRPSGLAEATTERLRATGTGSRRLRWARPRSGQASRRSG